MNTERKRLILDHLHHLLTLQQVADKLSISVQRAFQLKEQLFIQYKVPARFWNDGPAVARYVAAQDLRNRAWTYTPEFFYHYERFRDY